MLNNTYSIESKHGKQSQCVSIGCNLLIDLKLITHKLISSSHNIIILNHIYLLSIPKCHIAHTNTFLHMLKFNSELSNDTYVYVSIHDGMDT